MYEKSQFQVAELEKENKQLADKLTDIENILEYSNLYMDDKLVEIKKIIERENDE